MTSKFFHEIYDLINNMDSCELIGIYNEYCDSNCSDDNIYSMDDINEILCDMKPYEILNLAHYGEFNPYDDYFKFDGYGNLETFCEYEIENYIEIDDIVNYCMDNDSDLWNDEIREILDRYTEFLEEEEEEEENELHYMNAELYGGVVC